MTLAQQELFQPEHVHLWIKGIFVKLQKFKTNVSPSKKIIKIKTLKGIISHNFKTHAQTINSQITIRKLRGFPEQFVVYLKSSLLKRIILG